MKYARPVSSYSGRSTTGDGRRYTGPGPAKTEHRVFIGGDLGFGTALCGSCGCPVGLNQDGTFRGHRIGPAFKNSWLCPGNGLRPAGEVTIAGGDVMSGTMHKSLRPLARQAAAAGWQIEATGGGHQKWISPVDGTAVIVSSTPSNGRTMQNVRAELRRHGLADPVDPKAARAQTRKDNAAVRQDNSPPTPRDLAEPKNNGGTNGYRIGDTAVIIGPKEPVPPAFRAAESPAKTPESAADDRPGASRRKHRSDAEKRFLIKVYESASHGEKTHALAQYGVSIGMVLYWREQLAADDADVSWRQPGPAAAAPVPQGTDREATLAAVRAEQQQQLAAAVPVPVPEPAPAPVPVPVPAPAGAEATLYGNLTVIDRRLGELAGELAAIEEMRAPVLAELTRLKDEKRQALKIALAALDDTA